MQDLFALHRGECAKCIDCVSTCLCMCHNSIKQRIEEACSSCGVHLQFFAKMSSDQAQVSINVKFVFVISSMQKQIGYKQLDGDQKKKLLTHLPEHMDALFGSAPVKSRLTKRLWLLFDQILCLLDVDGVPSDQTIAKVRHHDHSNLSELPWVAGP